MTLFWIIKLLIDKSARYRLFATDTADVRRRQEHIVRPLGCKELVHSGLIRQIQFRMRTKQEVRIPFATQIIQDGGAYQAPVTGNKYFTVFFPSISRILNYFYLLINLIKYWPY